jgi:hypothetical protein
MLTKGLLTVPELLDSQLTGLDYGKEIELKSENTQVSHKSMCL